MADGIPRTETIPSRRHFALLNHGERIAGLGSWEWTVSSGTFVCSDNAFRLFGLEPGEIEPSLEFFLSRVHPVDRARVTKALWAVAEGQSGALDEERVIESQIVRSDERVTALRITVATYEGDARAPVRIIGALQDVTLQRRTDRRLAAYAAVTTALDQWTSFDQGVDELLARMGAAMELAFAAFWVPDGSTLAAGAIWHLPTPALESVAEATRLWRPGLGSAPLGRAFASRQPIIIEDASSDSRSDRGAAIRAAGLRGAIAVPAVALDEALAVFELWSPEMIEESAGLERALNGIGHEIGYFLSHRRGHLTAPVLTARELAVLQLAGRGHSAAQIAAELYLSPATVKRHFERAYAALGVADRAAAVGEAMRRGLIS
jgi:DNA-binding CsgD family transcriptional regulator